MSREARAFWQLLDNVEDLLRHGERTSRDVPSQVLFREEARELARRQAASPRGRGADSRRAGVAAVGGPSAARAGAARADSAGAGAVQATAAPTGDVRTDRLAMLEDRVRACTRCALHQERMNAVPGMGVLDPLVMVIGEGPGADEDHRGLPFVGRAGQFLDKWLEAIGMSRHKNVYITNVVKCRPPGNRDPRPHESEACLPYLREQIKLVQPQTILAVGRIASGTLIGSDAGIGRLRGRTYSFNGTPLVPTYHPSGVLRNPELKRPVWEDLKRLKSLLESIAQQADAVPSHERDG
ncbi:MAG: uracil-DNA glycosylase [Spirochaetales bacterium]